MITAEGRGAACKQAYPKCISASETKKIPVDIDKLPSVHVVKMCRHRKYPTISDDGGNACLMKILWDDNDDTFAAIDRATLQLRRNIIAMTREIAARCDGAKSKDKHGFSKWDADTGNRVAEFGIEQPPIIVCACATKDSDYKPLVWNSEYLKRWARKLWSYRQQISGDFYERMFVGEE